MPGLRLSAVLKKLLPALLPALFLAPLCHATDSSGISSDEIDRLTQRAMKEFNVPGMAIGVVQNGEIVYAKGHGIRELGQPEAVNVDTMFKIASNSKAFTSAALAILVDEGRISWDGAVADYIPEFRMADPWVTAEISVTDLLSHRSGLVAHAGDLMLWPDPNLFTRRDIIRGLRYFPLVSDFRSSYNYDNVLYIVAGEIVPRVTGQSWESFVDKRIMGALDMNRCFAGEIPAGEMTNLAAPHSEIEGELTVIERSRIHAEPAVYAAAGGVVCSVSDMLKWVRMHLGHGTAPDGTVLFSPARSREMWSPENWWGVSARNYEWHRTHFNGYGLGWRLSDVHGYKEVSHTGSLEGMRAWTLMIPELDLGIVVLANGSNTSARNAVMHTIKYSFLPVEQRDWVATYKEMDEQEKQASEEEVQASEAAFTRQVVEARPLDQYSGRYRDAWFGDVSITATEQGLEFVSARSPKLSGLLEHVSADTFVARWPDRSVGMDAWIRFDFDRHNKLARLKMNRVFDSPDATIDFFEYLNLKPID